MKELSNALKPLKNKLTLEKCLNLMIIGLCAGIFIDGLLIAVSKFTLVSGVLFLIAPLGCLGISFLAAIIKRPSVMDTAKTGDALGFKERFVTAAELCKKESLNDLAILVIKDACDKASKADFKRLYKLNISKKNLRLMLCILAAVIITALIPSPVSAKLDEQAAVKAKINEEIKNINETKKTVNRKELDPEINKLIKELKNAKTEGEAIKAIVAAEQQLKKISKQYHSKDLAAIGEKLAQNESTRQLGEKIKSGDISKIKEEIDALKESLAYLSDEDLKRLADSFREAAAQSLEDDSMNSLLNELENTLKDADLSAINDSLSEFSETLERLANENADLMDAIKELDEAVEKSRKNLEDSQRKETGKNEQQGQQGQEQQQAQGEGQQGQGEPQANGEGQQGQGQQLGGGQQSQQGEGEGRGQGHIENESIYSRKAIGYSDYEANIEGTQNSGGNMEEIEQKGIGNIGASVSYDKVYNSYKKEALTLLEEDNIPYGLKDIVKEYFSSLE